MIGKITKAWMRGDTRMRRDLRLLCWMLRQEVIRGGHRESWNTLVHLRRLAVRHESGDTAADREFAQRFQQVPLDELNEQVRLLGLFFDFANISEDLQRERVLRQRRASGTLSDSLNNRLKHLNRERPDLAERRKLLRNLEAEFVFTAHPTEAKRQTTRRILTRIRSSLYQLDLARERSERRRHLRDLREDVSLLLRTDPLHPHRPSVLEELDRALYVSDVLWNAVPGLVAAVDGAAEEPCSPLRFGCWIGGDRDGHPHVTVEITRKTLIRLRDRVLKLHLKECDGFLDHLAIRSQHPEAQQALENIVRAAESPELNDQLERLHPGEPYRRALLAIRFRLLEQSPRYRRAAELASDIGILAEALRVEGLTGPTWHRLLDWQRKTRVFGLHLMRLDIRENSKGYRDLMRGLLTALGEDSSRVNRDDFEGLWECVPAPVSDNTLREQLDERAWDLFAVTRLMSEWAGEVGPEAVGVNVISMTHTAGDVLWVLWLHRLIAHWRGDDSFQMPISPLFETIDDLQRSASILEELITHPAYRSGLAGQRDQQIVMVGYSDSAKDGGYLAACWALYSGQTRMQAMADRHHIQLTFFHGRGGALGRGGGPAARAIESLPPAEGDAHIRMTEQGEVIADRFADPLLAHRHMEQILGGLVVHTHHAPREKAEWSACMETFAAAGREAYLQLIHHQGFSDYFRWATPIRCIENLPIGSRPSRRHGAQSLEDLRAIPYTFSWTQSRQLINAFYGLGTAWNGLDDAQRNLCKKMYREWPFFTSMIDNAELALTKCDAGIANEYAKRVPDPVIGRYFGGEIACEIERTRKAILGITHRSALMAETTWLQRSVEIRKPFIDILNHIQIELLTRAKDDALDDHLEASLRLSVQGIAAGLRTTG
jgi:phosphoenolpyruvate carboxylase